MNIKNVMVGAVVLAVLGLCVAAIYGYEKSSSAQIKEFSKQVEKITQEARQRAEQAEASAASTDEVKAEPESYADTNSQSENGETSTDQQSQEQPAQQAQEEGETREELTADNVEARMLDLEVQELLLESKVNKSTRNLAMVQRMLQHVKDDLKGARAAFVAHDEDSSNRELRMVGLAEAELDKACESAGIKQKTLQPAK